MVTANSHAGRDREVRGGCDPRRSDYSSWYISTAGTGAVNFSPSLLHVHLITINKITAGASAEHPGWTIVTSGAIEFERLEY